MNDLFAVLDNERPQQEGERKERKHGPHKHLASSRPLTGCTLTQGQRLQRRKIRVRVGRKEGLV